MQKESLEQELNRLFYLIHYSPNTIIFTDPEGRIQYVNAVFTSWTGYQASEVEGRHVDELRLDDLSSTTMAYCWDHIRDGYVWEGELLSIRKDGSQFPEQVFLLPITNEYDQVSSVAFIKRDISAQKAAEMELLGLTESLEQRVSERTQLLEATNRELMDTLDQLQRMQSQLVESEKMASLGELIAGIAHEINTPVGIAYTASTHLEKTTRDFSKLVAAGGLKRSDLQAFMDTCLESTRLLASNLTRASELIRSFKQVAIDQSGEAKRRFYLRPYIEEVLLSLRPLLKKTNHTVQLQGDRDFSFSSFPGAFSQILTNLISNSISHAYGADEAGKLAISFEKLEHSLQLVYRDDGRGIREDAMEQIFSPLFTTNREQGGSGLGLHVVYNLVTQKLHGTISCQSAPGQGTTFQITIPVAH